MAIDSISWLVTHYNTHELVRYIYHKPNQIQLGTPGYHSATLGQQVLRDVVVSELLRRIPARTFLVKKMGPWLKNNVGIWGLL